jgi:hypothetical protein
MTNEHIPSSSLLKPTLIAVIIAVVSLVVFILPAEYNIDPTGLGEKIGLTILATSLSQKAPAIVANKQITEVERNDTVEVIVPAGKGVEYKFQLDNQQTMKYTWKTSGENLFLDLHGEPKGDTTGYYESYTIATAHEMSGQFTAPFSGIHGWYWKNKSEQDITVTLTTSGSYQVVGLKK